MSPKSINTENHHEPLEKAYVRLPKGKACFWGLTRSQLRALALSGVIESRVVKTGKAKLGTLILKLASLRNYLESGKESQGNV